MAKQIKHIYGSYSQADYSWSTWSIPTQTIYTVPSGRIAKLAVVDIIIGADSSYSNGPYTYNTTNTYLSIGGLYDFAPNITGTPYAGYLTVRPVLYESNGVGLPVHRFGNRNSGNYASRPFDIPMILSAGQSITYSMDGMQYSAIYNKWNLLIIEEY